MFEWPDGFAALILLLLDLTIAIVGSIHALLVRRSTETTLAWIALLWLAPFFGGALYVLLGVNRIRRRGSILRMALEDEKSRIVEQRDGPRQPSWRDVEHLSDYQPLIELVERVTDLPLLPGNQVTPLVNGDEAYPAMLHAIREAKRTISLESYIFDDDRAGGEFFEALRDAHTRGVAVRVLIDDVGSRYSRPTMIRRLHDAGIPCGRFLPTRSPFSLSYANLRNHRKILVCDGRVGFTGGMNIRERCRLQWKPAYPVQDLHFRVEGPVVGHLQQSFAADWTFVTGQPLEGDEWFPTLEPHGEMWSRGVPDGPDEDIDQLPLTIQGAIALARRRIDIVTPYFLPDRPMVAALNVAALRGVEVRILIPERTNIFLVQWAAAAQMHNVLIRGSRIFATPPPFDHTKLMLVDDEWSLVGSSNLDPRSLRLNFEFNVECYSRELNEQLSGLVEHKIAAARPVTRKSLDERSTLLKLRDSLASLATPYL